MTKNKLYFGVFITAIAFTSSVLELSHYVTSRKYNLSRYTNQFKKIFKIQSSIHCALFCTKTGSCNAFHFDSSSDVCSVSNIPTSRLRKLFTSGGNGMLLWVIDLPETKKKISHNYNSPEKVAEISLRTGNEISASFTEISILYVNGETVVFCVDSVNVKVKIFYHCHSSNEYCHNSLSLKGRTIVVGRSAKLSDTEVVVSDTNMFKLYVVKVGTNKSLSMSRILHGTRAYVDLENIGVYHFAGIYTNNNNFELRIDVMNKTDAVVNKTVILKNRKAYNDLYVVLLWQPSKHSFVVSSFSKRNIYGFNFNGVMLWEIINIYWRPVDLIGDHEGNRIIVFQAANLVVMVEEYGELGKTILDETHGIRLPVHATCDKDGFLYIAEAENAIMKVYTFK